MHMTGDLSGIYAQPAEIIEKSWLENMWFAIYREELMPDGVFLIESKANHFLVILIFLNDHIN